MSKCNHDERFKGVIYAYNGCLACECEHQAERANQLEQQLIKLREWCIDKYNIDVMIGKEGLTLVECAIKVIEDNVK